MLIGRRYELEGLIGHGGMGRVFRALDRLTGQRVALKQVAMGLPAKGPGRGGTPASDEPPARQTNRIALAHEFRTLATLRHPNIVSVLDYGFDENREPFFTMELLDKPRDLLRATSALSLPEKLDILAQLLRALTYLHRCNIVHRDLKPRNRFHIGKSPALFPKSSRILGEIKPLRAPTACNSAGRIRLDLWYAIAHALAPRLLWNWSTDRPFGSAVRQHRVQHGRCPQRQPDSQ